MESREQLVLNGVFNAICNGVIFAHGGNNANFYHIVFDHDKLSPHTSAHERPTTVDFEGIDIVVSGINILECEFDVYLCESNIANEIFNGVINGMWYYLFWFLLFGCFLPFSELGPPEPLLRGVCCFLKFLTGQPDGGAIESRRGEEEAEPFDMLFYSVDIILAQKSYNIYSIGTHYEKKNMVQH